MESIDDKKNKSLNIQQSISSIEQCDYDGI
jgi:hypothetical protein